MALFQHSYQPNPLESFKNIPFRLQEMSVAYPNCANLAMKAKRLEREGEIMRLKKGLYVVNPNITRSDLHPFLIANHLHGPSYVSMQSALRYYGLIPESVFTVQSVTTGIAREYSTPVGQYSYTHVKEGYYPSGITVLTESGISFIIATPEKALCDLMVYTPNLNLRYQSSIREYLEQDIRFDIEALSRFNIGIMEECVKVSRKKTMLNQLIKLIKHDQSI